MKVMTKIFKAVCSAPFYALYPLVLLLRVLLWVRRKLLTGDIKLQAYEINRQAEHIATKMCTLPADSPHKVTVERVKAVLEQLAKAKEYLLKREFSMAYSAIDIGWNLLHSLSSSVDLWDVQSRLETPDLIRMQAVLGVPVVPERPTANE